MPIVRFGSHEAAMGRRIRESNRWSWRTHGVRRACSWVAPRVCHYPPYRMFRLLEGYGWTPLIDFRADCPQPVSRIIASVTLPLQYSSLHGLCFYLLLCCAHPPWPSRPESLASKQIKLCQLVAVVFMSVLTAAVIILFLAGT